MTPTVRIITRVEVGDHTVELVRLAEEKEATALLGEHTFRRGEVLDHLTRYLLGGIDESLVKLGKKLKEQP